MRTLSIPLIACSLLSLTGTAGAQQVPPVTEALVRQLLDRLAADEARIRELELQAGSGLDPVRMVPAVAPLPAAAALPAAPPAVQPEAPAAAPIETVTAPSQSESMDNDPHDHMMALPGGGPTLKFRGYTDFNFDTGANGNPLLYPLGATPHNSFQLGEFDLFMSSKLSDHLSFVGEMVLGADATNEWGLDIERMMLTWRANRYFEISGGRYHSAIGYYNTMFHHGTWFQTATGRPYMYLFEDSGGLLPVHNVGATATGVVPGLERLGLHWIAEVGNGRAAIQSTSLEPVQNFLSDRNHKSMNFATFLKPEWLEGLQIGGNYYRDRLFPDGVTGVTQTVAGAYVVYNNSNWEFLNEAVLLRDESGFDHRTYNSPMMYTQISRRFGEYRPYIRYQYVNSIAGDPLSGFHGLYQGPSFGLRYNVSPYAALKFQYNRLYQTGVSGINGMDTQLAFTF